MNKDSRGKIDFRENRLKERMNESFIYRGKKSKSAYIQK